MRVVKKGIAALLCAAMVVTLVPTGSADAAKKPSLKKKTSVEVGKTVTIKVKNAKKKAKVTWKTSKKAVAKITKKITKGKKASATIQGVKEGKAKITAVYKLGKTKKKLTCKVTVTAAAAQTAQPTAGGTANTAVPTANNTNQTAAPTDNGGTMPSESPSETPEKTAKPTREPTPVPTPSPTPLPDDKPFDFEVPENGIPIDVSSYVSASGTGAYNADKKKVEINDTKSDDKSQGSWALPEEIASNIKTGDVVTFRVQGYSYGDSGFRLWLGTPTGGGCTPVMLLNEIDEALAIDPALGYPCAKDADGNVMEGMKGEDIQSNGDKYTVYNQMQINADPDTKSYDLTFSFKAGTSQDDTSGTFSHLTLKHIYSGGTIGYINGLVIKNIYYIDPNYVPPTASPEPEPTETPAVKLPGAEKLPEGAEITVDGLMDDAYADVAELPIDSRVVCDNAGDSTTKATAKVVWDPNNLYVYVNVKDENVDATAANDYQQDGVEIFLDEDNSRETGWDNNTDAFQYRFTGLTKNEEGAANEALKHYFAGGSDGAKEAYAGIESAYAFTEEGYAVEFKVPFKEEKADGAVVGFDIIVQDCKDGGRDAEIYYSETEVTKNYWNLSDVFAELTLLGNEPVEPDNPVEKDVITLDLSNPSTPSWQANPASYKQLEDGSVELTWPETADDYAGVTFDFPAIDISDYACIVVDAEGDKMTFLVQDATRKEPEWGNPLDVIQHYEQSFPATIKIDKSEFGNRVDADGNAPDFKNVGKINFAKGKDKVAKKLVVKSVKIYKNESDVPK